jgi:hypothetical protein
VPKCGIGKFDPSNRYVHFFSDYVYREWFTPGKSCKKCDTKPFSGFVFELLHFYESVFPLIRESISEAIKRKLSNRDYKMKKMHLPYCVCTFYYLIYRFLHWFILMCMNII